MYAGTSTLTFSSNTATLEHNLNISSDYNVFFYSDSFDVLERGCFNKTANSCSLSAIGFSASAFATLSGNKTINWLIVSQ